MTHISKTKGILMLVFATMLWGLTFPVSKLVSGAVHPVTFIIMRSTISILFLSAIFFPRFKLINRKTIIGGSLMGFFTFLSLFFQMEGMKYTTASNSAFITSLCVVLVLIFSVVSGRKKPHLSLFLSVFVATVGLAFICGVVNLPGFTLNLSSLNFGDVLNLLSAISVAVYLMITDRYVGTCDPIMLNYITVAVIIPCSLIVLPFTSREIDLLLGVSSPLVISMAAYCGIFASGIAFILMLYVQKTTDPVHISIVCTAEPVFAAIYALFIPDNSGKVEHFTLSALIGSLLILAGVLISQLDWSEKKKSVSERLK